MPVGPSLYDILLGHIDGEALEDHNDNTLEILSVQANVRRILNTRAGALKHVPDCGVPDLTEGLHEPADFSSRSAQLDARRAAEVRAVSGRTSHSYELHHT
jgi:predicted component of type VI protein secretion system